MSDSRRETQEDYMKWYMKLVALPFVVSGLAVIYYSRAVWDWLKEQVRDR